MAELVIALDYPTKEAALSFARSVQGKTHWLKVGLELYTACGAEMVQALKNMGFSVFVDLKFFDIPNTVQGAVRSAVRAGADMVNIHLLGGERMARAAVEGLNEGYAARKEADPTAVRPILLGVTVLTSMSVSDLPQISERALLQKETTALDDAVLPALVLQLAHSGSLWGLDGVVCSAFEAEQIKSVCGANFLCLTPGIRPAGSASDDQRRIMTPKEAVQAGSDYLVMGRPITKAENPAAVIVAVQKDIA